MTVTSRLVDRIPGLELGMGAKLTTAAEKDCKFLWTAELGVCVGNGITAPNLIVTNGGLALPKTGEFSIAKSDYGIPDFADELTVFVLSANHNIENIGAADIVAIGDASSSSKLVSANYSAGTTFYFYAYYYPSYNGGLYVGGGYWASNRSQCSVFTYKRKAVAELCCDGVVAGTSVPADLAINLTGTSYNFNAYIGSGNNKTPHIKAVGIYTRALSRSEALALSGNPEQFLFEPQELWTPFTVAGITAPTLLTAAAFNIGTTSATARVTFSR